MNFIHHHHISINKKGTDFVASDIHGDYSQLMHILKQRQFDPSKDRLFCVGDIIDRGEESEECLKLLLAPWFKPVLGNHELMLVKLLDDSNIIDSISKNGGQWLSKYIDSPATIRRWVELIKLRMPIAIKIKTKFGSVGITHAEPPMDWDSIDDINIKTDYIDLVTSRDQLKRADNINVKNITFTIHGHSNVNKVTRISNRFWIDTLEYTGKICVRTIDELYAEARNEE